VIAGDICCQKKQTEPILVEGEWSYDDFKTDTFTVMYDREGANGYKSKYSSRFFCTKNIVGFSRRSAGHSAIQSNRGTDEIVHGPANQHQVYAGARSPITTSSLGVSTPALGI
jgi:hypothetical protein